MSSILTLQSPAKINLTLDILRKDEVTGYHFIQTILQRINIFDTMEFRSGSHGLQIDTNVELPHDNTIVKAYQEICRYTGKPFDLGISIKKRIPFGAGLGGASSNAATMLVGMNHFFSLNIATSVLMELGAKIGKDIPFFVSNASIALGSHFGEKITSLPAMPDTPLLVIYPKIQRSTPEAYGRIDLTFTGKHVHKTDMLVDILRRTAFHHERFLSLLHNDFEASFFHQFPKLLDLKSDLEESGAQKVLLTGSGSSLLCFGTSEYLSRTSEKLRRKYKVFISSTY